MERLASVGHAPVLSQALTTESSAELSGRVYPTAKADAQAQRVFLDGVLLPLMTQAEADPDSPPLFVHATHPAYDAHPVQGWIRRGEQAVLPSNHDRVNVTLNGALSWLACEVITREAVKFTGPEMVSFFAKDRGPLPRLAPDHRHRRQRHLQSRHRGARVARQARLPGIVYLPPYAPNLNLIERLW